MTPSKIIITLVKPPPPPHLIFRFVILTVKLRKKILIGTFTSRLTNFIYFYGEMTNENV